MDEQQNVDEQQGDSEPEGQEPYRPSRNRGSLRSRRRATLRATTRGLTRWRGAVGSTSDTFRAYRNSTPSTRYNAPNLPPVLGHFTPSVATDRRNETSAERRITLTNGFTLIVFGPIVPATTRPRGVDGSALGPSSPESGIASSETRTRRTAGNRPPTVVCRRVRLQGPSVRRPIARMGVPITELAVDLTRQ